MGRTRWLALAGMCLAACGCEKKTDAGAGAGSAAPAPGTQVAAAEPSPSDAILIGEIGSLTGPQATFGISTKQGVQLAVDEANVAGGVKGKKLAVRLYDDQCKPEEAANAATRLVAQDHVAVVLGEVASTNSLAMAPKCQAAHVPMISPSSTNPKVTEVGDYIFRVCFIDPFQGFVMAKFAREHLSATAAAVLKDQKSDYSQGLTDVFTRKFAELGGKIVSVETFAQGDTDFRAQLTAIKGAKPQVIYIPGYYTDVGLIARQARELGIKAILLGGDGWESEKLFELGGSAVEGSYYTNHYSPEDPTPRVQEFIANYKKVWGVVPDSLAALGYDSARVAIDAMKRAPDSSGPALRDTIAKTKDFPGVAGTITLDENRNPVKSAVVLQVKDGKTVYVTSIAP